MEVSPLRLLLILALILLLAVESKSNVFLENTRGTKSVLLIHDLKTDNKD